MAEKLGSSGLIINLFSEISDGTLDSGEGVVVAGDVSRVGLSVLGVHSGLTVGSLPFSIHPCVSCLVISNNTIDGVQGLV